MAQSAQDAGKLHEQTFSVLLKSILKMNVSKINFWD